VDRPVRGLARCVTRRAWQQAVQGSRFRVTKRVNAASRSESGSYARSGDILPPPHTAFFFTSCTPGLVNDRNRGIDTMPLFSCHIRRAISGGEPVPRVPAN